MTTEQRSALGGLLHGVPVRLAPDQLAELADLVAERLQQPATQRTQRIVTAETVGAAIGRTAEWVREHGAELGGRRMGTGLRPRWGFDLDEAVSAWSARQVSERSTGAEPVTPLVSRRRVSGSSGSGVELLPIRESREDRRAA
jgi:hypothetical protein